MRTNASDDDRLIALTLEYGEEAAEGRMIAISAQDDGERITDEVEPDRIIMPDQFPHRRPNRPTMTLLV